MKVIGDDTRPMDRDSLVEVAVDAEGPGAQRSFDRRLEVHDLCGRMYARVGSPGAMHRQGDAGNLGDRFLECLLHRATVRLALPTAESPAIVLDGEGYSRGGGRPASRQEIFRSRVSASVT